MRRACRLLLSLLLVQAQLAQALPSRQFSPDGAVEAARKLTAEGMPRSFEALRRSNINAREFDSELGKIKSSRSVELGAHVGQTLVFLLTVAGIDLVLQEMRQTPGPVSEQSLGTMAGHAAQQILDSGSTWSSMASAGATGALLNYPVKVLTTLIADPKGNKLLFETLRSSILSTATFVGWDAGAQLWKEASYLLEDPNDYQRSSSLFGVGRGAVQALLFSSAPQDARDLRIAGLMFANLMRVALFDQELRANWINNTWRTRIMSGEFVTLLGSILTASAVGTVILPGGGTVAGFMFGLAGATVSLVIPQEIKDGITGTLQSVRGRVVIQQMYTNTSEMRYRLSRSKYPGVLNTQERVAEFAKLLERRHALRSNYVTIRFERARLDLKALLNKATTSVAAISLREDLHNTFAETLSVLADEKLQLSRMREAAADPVPAELRLKLAEEEDRVEVVRSFLARVSAELESALGEPGPVDFKALSDNGKVMVKYIEVAYARSFDENKLMELTE
jgi:hypothetical protein